MRSRKMQAVATIGILVLALGLAAACAQAPQAAAPQDFYRGKTFTWVVPSEAGSGTDSITRVVAPYLAKEIGATVKVENQGTDEGVNYVYTEAKRDGLTMVVKSSGAFVGNDILKAPGTLYEIDKFNMVVDLHPTVVLFVTSPKSPYKTLDALRQAKGLKGGASSAKGSLAIGGAVMLEILGLDGKVISGYKSSKDVTLALARGEVDFLVTSDNGAGKDEDDGLAVSFMTVSPERSRVVPNTPTMFELGVKVSQELEAAHKFISMLGYATALPPDVPNDRIEFMRQAFVKIGDDKALQNDLAKVAEIWVPFTPGKQLQETIAAVKANKSLASQLDAIHARYSATR
ncbi:MAG: hypothetical protein HYY30_13025 [Chloroflexi bacterium]|nr:hypothetical protein [Chloroflexota bacterium]